MPLNRELADLVTIDPFTEAIGILDSCSTVEDAIRSVATLESRITRILPEGLIDSTATVSGLAKIGTGVVIGPDVVVHEFCSLRRCVIGPGVEIGFGCEIADSVVMANSTLSHRANVASSIIGQQVHVGANVVTANVSIYNDDPRRPSRPIKIRYCGRSGKSELCVKIGAIVGDGARLGVNAVTGPGALIGKRSIVCAGVVLAEIEIDSDMVIKNDRQHIVEKRRTLM